MPANDGKQRSGATAQPGGPKGPGNTAVPNYPKKSKDGQSIPTPTFPSGDTARPSRGTSAPDGD